MADRSKDVVDTGFGCLRGCFGYILAIIVGLCIVAIIGSML